MDAWFPFAPGTARFYQLTCYLWRAECFAESEVIRMHLQAKKILLVLAVVAAVAAAAGTVGVTNAKAYEVRYQTWNRYDVLLSGYETNSAGTSLGAAMWICGGGGLLARYPMVLYGFPYCTAIVATCALRARLRGRWAGFTLQPFLRLNYWCWDY